MAPLRKITEFTRTDIVDALLLDKEHPFHGNLDLVSFLKRVWPLDSMPSRDSRFKNASGDIWQHVVTKSVGSTSAPLYQIWFNEHCHKRRNKTVRRWYQE
jgi:hypothetical protein